MIDAILWAMVCLFRVSGSHRIAEFWMKMSARRFVAGASVGILQFCWCWQNNRTDQYWKRPTTTCWARQQQTKTENWLARRASWPVTSR